MLGETSVELYFQSESRAVSMKDLVREFIRKAHVVGLVCTSVCVCVQAKMNLTCLYMRENMKTVSFSAGFC